MEYPSNRSTMKRKGHQRDRANSYKDTLSSPINQRILHRHSNMSFLTDKSIDYENLKSKYNQLKQEKARLIAIINSKDTQINLIETQLKKLESDFYQYKSLSRKVLTPNEKFTTETQKLIKSLEEIPISLSKDEKKYIPKLKEYVFDNKIYKALVTALRISLQMANPQELKNALSPPPEDSFDALTKESKYLLESINKQSLKISKITSKNNK